MTIGGRWMLTALLALSVPALIVVPMFRSPTPATPTPPLEPVAPVTRAGVVGSASCSASGCHGGPISANGTSSDSAATLWSAHDPHARASDALRTEAGRRCHAPAAEVAGVPSGGAGRACTECHTYHGTLPHRGPAAPARDPRTRLELSEFLKGIPPARP